MDHQEEGKEQLSEVEGSGEDDQGDDHSESAQKVKGQPRHKRLFTFSLVNSCGTADINSLATDGKLLKLNCKCLLAPSGRLGAHKSSLGIVLLHIPYIRW
jgi:ubiquitin carboxyl-terminal hydrolase 4/11/15